MERGDFSKEGGELPPDTLASAQPALTPCRVVLGPARTRLWLHIPALPSLPPFALAHAHLPWFLLSCFSWLEEKNKHLRARQLTCPLLWGLAENTATPAHLGEFLGIPSEEGVVQKLKLAACCDD